MAAAIIHSLRSIVDTNGIPISGALITVYDAGTTTKRAIYSDSTLMTAADNPIVCTGGVCPLRYTASGSYKVDVTEADGTALTRYNGDNIDTGVAVGSGALPIASGGTASTTAAAARTALSAASVTEVADIAADVGILQDTLTGTDATQLAAGTTAQRPVSPQAGQIRYNSTTSQFEAYGAAWDAAILTAATQAQMEAASSLLTVATPGAMKWHPGVAKGYVKFDVSGAIQGTALNVSSVTDGGTGSWTINWTTPFSSANYAVAYSFVGGVSTRLLTSYIGNQAAGTLQILTVNQSSAAADEAGITYIIVTAFGDQ